MYVCECVCVCVSVYVYVYVCMCVCVRAWYRNLNNEAVLARVGLLRHRNKKTFSSYLRRNYVFSITTSPLKLLDNTMFIIQIRFVQNSGMLNAVRLYCMTTVTRTVWSQIALNG